LSCTRDLKQTRMVQAMQGHASKTGPSAWCTKVNIPGLN